MTKEERVRRVWELLVEAQHIDSEEYLRAMNDRTKVNDFKQRLAEAIEKLPFGDTAQSFAQFVREFK